MSLAACFSSPTTGPAYLRLPEYLDDYIAEDNPVRVIDVVDELDLGALLLADCPPPAERLFF
jgi:transposase